MLTNDQLPSYTGVEMSIDEKVRYGQAQYRCSKCGLWVDTMSINVTTDKNGKTCHEKCPIEPQ